MGLGQAPTRSPVPSHTIPALGFPLHAPGSSAGGVHLHVSFPVHHQEFRKGDRSPRA